MSNKGKLLKYCPECKKKRFCTWNWGLHRKDWVCSKGHKWAMPELPLEKIMRAEIDAITPKLKTLFNHDDAFFKNVRRR